MSDKTLTPESELAVVVTNAAVSNDNLSGEIASTIDRLPGDRVRVSRVYDNHYRVNWLAPKNRLEALETYFVRQSKFLHATKDLSGKLVIRPVGTDN